MALSALVRIERKAIVLGKHIQTLLRMGKSVKARMRSRVQEEQYARLVSYVLLSDFMMGSELHQSI